MTHQRILKNIYFWKYDSWFSSEVSKLTLVRNKLNFLIGKLIHGRKNCLLRMTWSPKNDQNIICIQYRLYLERVIIFRGHYVFVNFFYAWKCIISGVIFRSKLWHLIRKSSVIFSRMNIFSKFFGESWGAYKMRVKNENDSWTFY